MLWDCKLFLSKYYTVIAYDILYTRTWFTTAFNFSTELWPLICGLSLYSKYFMACYDACLQDFFFLNVLLVLSKNLVFLVFHKFANFLAHLSYCDRFVGHE